MLKKIEHSPNRLPLHVEISEMIAREIQAGILLEGTKLAPERKMANDLGVSVGTLRKALLDLEEKNLIQRKQGSGNYVRSTDPSQSAKANTIYGFFRLELIGGGGLPTAQVLSVRRLKKPDTIGNIGDNPLGYRIRRLRQLNKIDAAIEEIWLDADRCENISKEEIPDSLYLFYKEKLGFWITRADDSVSVSRLPDWKPESFGSPESTPSNRVNTVSLSEKNTADSPPVWGYIERLSYDQNNVCVEFSRTWFDPNTTRFVARWK